MGIFCKVQDSRLLLCVPPYGCRSHEVASAKGSKGERTCGSCSKKEPKPYSTADSVFFASSARQTTRAISSWYEATTFLRVMFDSFRAHVLESDQVELAVEVNGRLRRRYMQSSRSPTGFEILEEEVSELPQMTGNYSAFSKVPALQDARRAFEAFMLPAGYPKSVTPDYLQYMLWALPTHVTGWMYNSLTTASLLEAVGVSTSGKATSVVAATAAIKWLTKDGLGALGRVIVGGRFANVVDEDPKRWRMLAEGFATAGSLFELLTAAMPRQFLVLASMGTLSKAVSKGFAKPSFRVIQNHFAVSNNVGAVAAKEEVWEVLAQLVGLVLSVNLLQSSDLINSYESVFGTWVFLVSCHVAFRYKAIQRVQLPVINLRRAKVVLDVPTVNSRELLLLSGGGLTPNVKIGCTLEETLQFHRRTIENVNYDPAAERTIADNMKTSSSCRRLLELYADETYVLAWSAETSRACVSLKENANNVSVLRALWQASWLEFNRLDSSAMDRLGLVERSYAAVSKEFQIFETELERLGWQPNSVAYLLPEKYSCIVQ